MCSDKDYMVIVIHYFFIKIVDLKTPFQPLCTTVYSVRIYEVKCAQGRLKAGTMHRVTIA